MWNIFPDVEITIWNEEKFLLQNETVIMNYMLNFHVQDRILLWKLSKNSMYRRTKIWNVGHALAEGSRLTIPAPRRVRFFSRSVSDAHGLVRDDHDKEVLTRPLIKWNQFLYLFCLFFLMKIIKMNWVILIPADAVAYLARIKEWKKYSGEKHLGRLI